MKLIKILLSVIFIIVVSACSKSDPIYGAWSGKSEGDNSYVKINDESQDATKIPSKPPATYSRTVDLMLTNDTCKIVFDSNLDHPVDCLYKSDEKIIIIPSWRNKDSIYDSGLVITNLDETKLELENKFSRVFKDYSKNYEIRYEMKGSEFYLLKKQ